MTSKSISFCWRNGRKRNNMHRGRKCDAYKGRLCMAKHSFIAIYIFQGNIVVVVDMPYFFFQGATKQLWVEPSKTTSSPHIFFLNNRFQPRRFGIKKKRNRKNASNSEESGEALGWNGLLISLIFLPPSLMEMKTIYRGRRLYIGRGQRLESILSIYNLSTVSLMKSKRKKKVYSSWISLPPRLNGHQFRLRPPSYSHARWREYIKL